MRCRSAELPLKDGAPKGFKSTTTVAASSCKAVATASSKPRPEILHYAPSSFTYRKCSLYPQGCSRRLVSTTLHQPCSTSNTPQVRMRQAGTTTMKRKGQRHARQSKKANAGVEAVEKQKVYDKPSLHAGLVPRDRAWCLLITTIPDSSFGIWVLWRAFN